MRRTVAMILTLAILATSCGGFHYVDVTDEATPLDDINEALAHKNATVLLEDGTRLRVKHVELRADSTTFLTRVPRAPEAVVATRKIETIQVTSRRRAGLIGGLVGMVGGFLVGAAMGAESLSMSTEEAIGAGAIVGIAGFGAGAVMGTIIGHEQTYAIWAPGPLARQQDE